MVFVYHLRISRREFRRLCVPVGSEFAKSEFKFTGGELAPRNELEVIIEGVSTSMMLNKY